MISPEQDFRQIIRREFDRRCQAHRTYSLRAFARDLRLSPGSLSEVMNGKKGLSRAAAGRVAPRLGLNSNETQMFCDIVESRHARGKTTREQARSRLKKTAEKMPVETLRLDSFQAISDWHHFAILQLTEVTDFKPDPRWIADRLGISEKTATEAIKRLKRLGLAAERDGTLIATSEFVATPDVSSVAIGENHRQIHAKALLALETQTIDERDFSSIQMPVDSSDIPAAKTAIREFRRSFCERFSKVKKKDNVYCISIDFFNLTPKKEGKK